MLNDYVLIKKSELVAVCDAYRERAGTDILYTIPELVNEFAESSFTDAAIVPADIASRACTSVTIQEGASILTSRSFYNYTSLTSVIIPSSVTTMEVGVFFGCDNLTDIYVPWDEGAVNNAPWGAKNATIHYNSEV